MSSIDNILIYSIFFLVFFLFCKKNILFDRKKFWLFAFGVIILFSIVEGCRYGRGPDYLWYKYRFQQLSPIIEEGNPLFLKLMELLTIIGFNYIGAYIVYAFIFIFCSIYFIRKTFNVTEAQWMYICLLFASLINFESAIRQFLAIPILFVGISFLVNKKWFLSIICILAINFIHSGAYVALPFFLLFYYVIHKTLPYKYMLLIMFCAYYLIPSGSYVTDLFSLIQKLPLGSVLNSAAILNYVDEDNSYFITSVIANMQQTELTKFLQFIYECSILYISTEILKNRPNQRIMAFLNISFIGFVCCRLFHEQEMFRRLFDQLSLYYFIPLGYGLGKYSQIISKEKFYLTSKLIVISYVVFYWGRFIFLNSQNKFVWNV